MFLFGKNSDADDLIKVVDDIPMHMLIAAQGVSEALADIGSSMGTAKNYEFGTIEPLNSMLYMSGCLAMFWLAGTLKNEKVKDRVLKNIANTLFKPQYIRVLGYYDPEKLDFAGVYKLLVEEGNHFSDRYHGYGRYSIAGYSFLNKYFALDEEEKYKGVAEKMFMKFLQECIGEFHAMILNINGERAVA